MPDKVKKKSENPLLINENGVVKKNDEEEKEGRKDLIRALVLCLFAVILVRSFLFEPFKIPSPSMIPTLCIGDHIFVSKFTYGLSLPFTKLEFVKWNSPKRGDIIVFLNPREESLHYIKRVIGVPGDIVEFKDKDLIINGNLIKKELVEDPETLRAVIGVTESNGELFREFLDQTIHYVKYSKAVSHDLYRNKRTERIPENHFFVVGDNRDDSYDSRSWGIVPRENIKGKAQIIWMSLDREQSWKRLGKVRWERCGTLIY